MHFFNKTVLFVFVSLHVLLAKGTDMSADQKALDANFRHALNDNEIAYGEPMSLTIAAQCGHTKMLEQLLADGVDVNIADKYGRTALIWATFRVNASPTRTSCVKILLEHKKAAINATTCNGYTALMTGALIGHAQITKLLLDHGADANILNKRGLTAAMIADKEGHTEVAKTIRWSPLRNAWIGAVCRAQERLDLD